jgi:hypothetical protein
MKQMTTVPHPLAVSERLQLTQVASIALGLVAQKLGDDVVNSHGNRLLNQLMSLYQFRSGPADLQLSELELIGFHACHFLASANGNVDRRLMTTVAEFADAEYYEDGDTFFSALNWAFSAIQLINEEQNKMSSYGANVERMTIQEQEVEQCNYWKTIIALLYQQLAHPMREAENEASLQHLVDEAHTLVKKLSRDAERWR